MMEPTVETCSDVVVFLMANCIMYLYVYSFLYTYMTSYDAGHD